MKITVRQESDWSAIARVGGPVVDPMIVRSGEIFLRGASGAQDAGAAWDLLTRNVHAIGTFFDRIILDEQIPLFNYADSFDRDQNFNERTLSAVNADEEIFVDVDVGYEAYHQVRSAALAEMKTLYDAGHARVSMSEAANILGELSASGYAWYPRLDELPLVGDDEKKLAGFILGGLIFGGYAQLAGTDHLMQPKRSRLFLAISLKGQTTREGEEEIFAKFGELVGRPTADIPYTPTFFPLLLGLSSGPTDLLKNALKLRSSPEVRDYRAWIGEALADFDTNGRIPVARAKEVSRIASAIQQKVDGFPLPKVEIKATVTDVVAAKPPGIGIDLTAPAKAAWGWLVSQLPGKRHRKLLTRAVVADREYVELDRRISTVWGGGAGIGR